MPTYTLIEVTTMPTYRTNPWSVPGHTHAADNQPNAQDETGESQIETSLQHRIFIM